MYITDVQLADSGSYKCGNSFMASLVVVSPANCSPKVATLREKITYLYDCKVLSAGGPRPFLSWTMGRQEGLGNLTSERLLTKSSLVIRPDFRDHGKRLSCGVRHPWLRPDDAPLAGCAYEHLNIVFTPKILCRDPQFADQAER